TRELFNIAAVIRAMKNFGIKDLRLVQPNEYDAYRIEGIAHHTGDILARVQRFDDLDAALADCTLVVGLTARQRSAKRNALRPRDAAPEILSRAKRKPVALLLGTEDKGLTNDELDRCHRTVTIPTNPTYSSLNLAQAFTVMAYELFTAEPVAPLKAPRKTAPLATQELLELLFKDVGHALDAIDFFKTRQRAGVLRTVREATHRVPLDVREAALLRAMSLEVVRYLERTGRAVSERA
ncbi:MAG TPA: TrmJ/YjtD family RNA methyltransferase, partial [Gemmatimonadales bacterium]